MTAPPTMLPQALVLADGRLVVVYPDAEIRTEVFETARRPGRDIVLITRDGMFRERHDGLQHSLLPLETNPSLGSTMPFARLELPAVPARIFTQALAFMRATYRRYGTETLTLVYFDLATRRYRLEIPSQWVPAVGEGRQDSVEYEIPPSRSATEIRVASLHDHMGLGPEPSATDLRDTRHFPGLHGIWGWAESDRPVLGLYTVIHGRSLRAPIGRWVVGELPDLIPPWRLPSFPPEWIARVIERPPVVKHPADHLEVKPKMRALAVQGPTFRRDGFTGSVDRPPRDDEMGGGDPDAGA